MSLTRRRGTAIRRVGGKGVLTTLIRLRQPALSRSWPSTAPLARRPVASPIGCGPRSWCTPSAGITPDKLLELHVRAEVLPDAAELVSDVEERYQLETRALFQRAQDRAIKWASQGRVSRPQYDDMASQEQLIERVLSESGRELIRLELPDAEFLTALEHVVEGYVNSEFTAGTLSELFKYADQTLRAHGAPYRRRSDALAFEWIGDPAVHAATVEPALLALADPRLAGARAEFDEALAKRRRGAP